jgi:amino acid adenylation domain-containing protein
LITLDCSQQPPQLSLKFSPSFLGHSHALAVLNSLNHILVTVMTEPQTAVADICLVGRHNMDIVARWNHPGLLDQPELCIHSVFAKQCLQYPNAEAVHAWDGSLSYADVDALSGGIADHLTSLGVVPENVVPIYMEKSKWVVVSILGVLKAGGAFTLLDHSFPLDRVRMMCNDVGASVVITSHSLIPKASALGLEIFLVPDNLASAATVACSARLPVVKPSNAAYIAFTSGSTGKPKGIVVEHRSFCANMLANQRMHNLDETSRVLQFASFAFDISILELLMPPMVGACVCIPSEDQRVNALSSTIEEFEVNWLELTPSVARLVSPDSIPRVKTLLLGGEPMNPHDLRTWLKHVQLIGAYGPAECSVVTTLRRHTDDSNISNIGRAHGGHCWIVNPEDHDRLSPIGSVGELVISGPLVARGYINQPDQMAFIQPPKWASLFHISPNERFYKTGDLVRWDLNEDGLQFKGRKDTQVKLHGQRLELQEVEYQAEQFRPGSMVAAAEVLELDHGMDAKILALFLSDRENCPSGSQVPPVTRQVKCCEWISELQTWLQQKLPKYMVPTLYIPLESLPISPTGKLERRVLKEIGRKHAVSRSLSREPGPGKVPGDDARPLSKIERSLKRVFSGVLGVPEGAFGPEDAFFSLGGNSVTAIKAVSRAREEGLALSVADILSLQTVSRLAKIARKTEALEAIPHFSLIANPRVNIGVAATQCQVQAEHIEDIYGCTPVQEGLMVLSTKRPGSLVGQFSFYVPGDVGLDLLEAAWNQVAISNPILRTRIVAGENNRLMQAVVKGVPRLIHRRTLRECVDALSREPMQLGDPLTRVAFAVAGDESDSGPVLILAMHHAVFDGRSYMCILEDLHNAMLGGLVASRPQFNHLIKHIAQLDPTPAMSYWAQEFDGLQAPVFPTPVEHWTPTEKPCIEKKSFALGTIHDGGSTLTTTLRLAWAMVQSSHTCYNDVFYGMTVSGCNAPIPQIEEIAGPTIATFPTRVLIDPDQSVQAALDSIVQKDIARIPFEQVGLSNICQASERAAFACGFQTLLIIQPRRNESRWPTLRDLPRNFEQQQGFNTCSLTIVIELGANSVNVEAIFDGSILTKQDTQSLLNRFEVILQQIMADTSALLRSIRTYSDPERVLLSHWSRPRVLEHPSYIHDLIFSWGSANPAAEAVRAWDGSWSFGQLLDVSRALASHLGNLGACPETYVAVYMEKSKWYPVALLGILLTGAAFVLLDTNFPVDRLQRICSDVKVKTIVASQLMSEKCSSLGSTTVLSEQTVRLWERTTYGGFSIGSHSGAYVAFTSGSSGTPKGAVIEHAMLYHTFAAFRKVCAPPPGFRSLFFSSPAFDIAVMEVLFVLACGGCLCVPSEDDRFNNLPGVIRQLGVNFLILTPSVARTLAPSEIPSVHTMILLGEAVLACDITTWSDAMSLYVGYGPAECTLLTTMSRLDRVDPGPPKIGNPLNGSCWVAHPSDHNQLVPIGVVGELIIGGPIVGRGYIGRPKESAAAFIRNPTWAAEFGIPGDQRLYKTGDLVKYNWDGSLRIIGRKDTQVKLRGQRIELEEIEQCVRNYESNMTAVADVLQFSDTPGQQVVLFINTDDAMRTTENAQSKEQDELFTPLTPDLEMTLSGLREHLGRVLPSFMVPSAFIYLRHLPLTPSGKTNRKVLREHAAKTSRKSLETCKARALSTAGPSTDREKLVRSIFAHVLSKEEDEIGIHDNFFSLGDSISAMQVLNACRREGLHLTMPEFLVNNSASLVASSATVSPAGRAAERKNQTGEIFPLSPIQSMFCDMAPNIHSRFNQSFFVGVEQDYNVPEWEQALLQIVDRHPMLRMRLESRYAQIITSDVKGSFTLSSHQVLQTEDVSEIVELAQARVDPVKGPLLAVDLISTAQGGRYASFVASHMVVDLVSWRIILDDLENLLKGKSLPVEHPLSFQEWVGLQIEQCTDYRPQQVLPFGMPLIDTSYWGLAPHENLFGDGLFEEFSLDLYTTHILMGEANETFGSRPQDILNAALLYSFMEVFQDRAPPTIFNESHGREPFNADIDPFGTVGWFTTIWPCIVAQAQDYSFTELVRRVKDASKLVPGNGRPYFSSRYVSPHCKEAFASHSPVEILVNYAGQYHQLERRDSLFSQPAWRPDPRLDVARDMPRFATFDVSFEVTRGRLCVSFFYSRYSKRQPDIKLWISKFQRTLNVEVQQLMGLPRQLSLSDIPLVHTDYTELSTLQNIVQTSLGVPSISCVEDIYPCSDAHAGLIEGFTGTASLHKVRSLWQIKNTKNLDACTVADAWNRVIQRHAVMRTVLLDCGLKAHKWLHVVLKQVPSDIPILRSASPETAKQKLMLLGQPKSEWKRPSNFFAVCQSAEGQVFFMFESGSALIDAASFSILLHDLNLILDGGELSGPSHRYREYISYLGKTPSNKGLLYWENVLSGVQPCLFPQLHPCSSTPGDIRRPHTLKRFMPDSEPLHLFCRVNGLTATNVFQLAWALVLRLYTGRVDVCFGTLVSGRDIPLHGVMETVGPFFNVLPCSLHLTGEMTPLQLLRQNQAAMQFRLENQHCSLLDIIRCTGLELDGLINTCLTVQPALSSSFSVKCNQADVGFELLEYDDPTEVCLTSLNHELLQLLRRKVFVSILLTQASLPYVVLFCCRLQC